jgi:hypothetical protein
MWLWIVIGVAIVWLLMNFKTSRADGTVVGKVHKYRTMMFYLMPRRNESLVFYDAYPRAERLLQYLADAKRAGIDADITHCLVAGALIGLIENPKMNQFVSGRRLYQRKGRSVTFTMKRKRMDGAAKLSAARLDQMPGETFRDLCERMNGRIAVERSSKRTYSDKELDLFLVLPRPLMNATVSVARWLDYHNLLPAGFINNDPFFVSMYIANLGSVGMDPGFHHLYEYGGCPLFMMAGKVRERAVVENGKVVVAKTLHIRWTYDERIDDGLTANGGIMSVNNVLEDPYRYLGCLAADGSDAHNLSVPPAERQKSAATAA